MKKALLLVLVACGSPPEMMMMTGTGGGSAGGSGGGSAGGSGGAGGGTTSSSALTVAECQTDMQRFADLHCSDEQQWLMMKTQVCSKIPNTTSAPCEASLTKAKTCHAQFQTATLGCNAFNQADSADPCAVDVLLAAFCVATVNSNLCVATQCMYNTDCSTGYSCNDKTNRCFKSDAACLGLPCKYNTDCPTGLTCNNAIEQCVRN